MKGQKNYIQKKKKLIQEAKSFLKYKEKNNLAWWDYYDYLEELLKRAKRYGLIRQLKNMGVI